MHVIMVGFQVPNVYPPGQIEYEKSSTVKIAQWET